MDLWNIYLDCLLEEIREKERKKERKTHPTILKQSETITFTPNTKKQMSYLKQTIFIATAFAFLTSCNVKDKLETMSKAKADSEFIMNNLNKPEIIDRFPEKYFPRERTRQFIDTLSKHCDFETKRGKFVDFYTMSINGASKTAYIYEYILNCDSLRFIYVYNIDTKEPELQNFNIEGIEVPNQMIIDPKKQLLNSGTK